MGLVIKSFKKIIENIIYLKFKVVPVTNIKEDYSKYITITDENGDPVTDFGVWSCEKGAENESGEIVSHDELGKIILSSSVWYCTNAPDESSHTYHIYPKAPYTKIHKIEFHEWSCDCGDEEDAYIHVRLNNDTNPNITCDRGGQTPYDANDNKAWLRTDLDSIHFDIWQQCDGWDTHHSSIAAVCIYKLEMS